MKTRLLLTIVFLFVISLVSAQDKQATVRIFESNNKNLSKIVIVYESGESEVIPLDNWNMMGTLEAMNRTLISNQLIINKMLNDMSAKGYKLVTATSTGEAYYYTFMVFTKQ